MRIGIDIDDTISNTASYLIEEAFVYDRLYKKKGVKDNTAYDFCDIFNWTRNDKYDYYRYIYDNNIHNMPIKPHAREIINKLKKEGHKIYIITRRDSDIYKDPYKESKNWLKKNKVKFDKLIVKAKDKGLACKKLNVDIFIDDLPSNCKRVEEENIKVLMFDTPYNKEEKNYKRVVSWEEIYNIVNEVK